MKTIKVIDLLNKIASCMVFNGEMPKKIKYDDIEFVWDISSSKYLAFDYEHQIYFTLNDQVNLNNDLNDTVEIIEDTQKEDNKIKKIDISKFPKRNNSLKKTALKLNEIIELLNNSVLLSEKDVSNFIDKVNGK